MPKSVDTTVLVLPSGQAIGTGLKLAAGQGGLPPDYGQIQWIRTTDGALIANIAGYETVNVDGIQTVVRPTDGTRQANIDLTAQNTDGSKFASLDVNAGRNLDPVGATSVSATAADGINSFSAAVIRANGSSDFLQLNSTQQLRMGLFFFNNYATPAIGAGPNFAWAPAPFAVPLNGATPKFALSYLTGYAAFQDMMCCDSFGPNTCRAVFSNDGPAVGASTANFSVLVFY